MSESRPIPGHRIQLLGIELTLLGGVLQVGVPLVGAQQLVAWGFLVGGLVATLYGLVA